MRFLANIHEPFYEFNDKKYIRIVVPEKIASIIVSMQEKKKHLIQNPFVDDPLDGNILRVKIPYRYRRCMCKVEGLIPVEGMERGARVDVDVSFSGVWNRGEHSGYAWKVDWIKNVD